MLTISSVAVSPLPQQAPTVRAQPVMPVRPSNAVSPESAGVSVVVVSGGDAARAEPVYAPSSLPPVAPSGEAAAAHARNNAADPERTPAPDAAVTRAAFAEALAQTRAAQTDAVGAAPSAETAQRAGQQVQRADEQARQVQRFRGELPPEVPSPTDQAMEAQINELVPNMWRASRAAVDMLIGEEARAAAAARAEVLAPQPEVQALEAQTIQPSERALEAAESYVRTAGGEPPTAGSQIDRRV